MVAVNVSDCGDIHAALNAARSRASRRGNPEGLVALARRVALVLVTLARVTVALAGPLAEALAESSA